MENNVWQLQEAKNKFSELVEKAQKKGPQIVTKHGRKTVVIMSFEEYVKTTKPRTDIVEFFRQSPIKGLNLEGVRNKDLPREVDL